MVNLLNYDPFQTLSGLAGVPTAQSTAENSTTSIQFASGTSAFVGPDQCSAWYQSGTTATVPGTQSSQNLVSGRNSLYGTGANVSNQQLAPFQSSGSSAPTANVPKSESSITH